jgi:DNA invertase Pin-like site-specific DNA recombinase
VTQPDTPALGAVVLGAGVLLLLGGLAGLTLARTHVARPGIAVPVPRGLIAEGEAPSVGHFRGGVELLILARRRFKRTSEAHYLVNAPAAKTPFWVAHSEIATFAVPRRERDAEGSERATEPPGQARPVETQGQGVRALGYATLRDSVGDESGDLRDQAGAIDSHCEEHGWRLLEVVHDMDDGNGKAFERPGLGYALDRITRGDAACLVVPGLERLSLSLTDLAKVIDAVRRGGGRLVVMDVGLDTSTSHGELAADTLVRIGAWERRRLGERTRKGLAAARAKGAAAGRPAVDDIPELKERIVTMRVEGMTLQAIADRLNDEGVPTLRGGREWRPSSVQAAAGYRRPRQPQGGGN